MLRSRDQADLETKRLTCAS